MNAGSVGNSEKLRPGYETVFTVCDYYDGPRSGVANFGESPYFYKCLFDESHDSYSDSFLLIPITKEAFEAALENWQIFLRWREAFDSGKTTRETHPALPEERRQYDNTQRILDEAIAAGRASAIQMNGEFEPLGDATVPLDGLSSWQVRWKEPNRGTH
jgi:hypothetical protein